MRIKLVRESFTNKATEGVLYIDDKFECYTLEDMDRDLENGGIKVQDQTAIPKGEYEVIVDMSTRFKRLMPRLLNVPGFTGIRIHSGNKAADTEGCIIVGSVNASKTDDWIGGSKDAYNKLFRKITDAINAGEAVTIQVM